MITIYMSRLKINSQNKSGKQSFFQIGQRLIPETIHGNYLYGQQKTSSRLIPETREDNYLWVNDCRLIPETRQDNYLREQIED